MAGSTMKVSASPLCRYTRSLQSGRTNCIVGSIRWATCSSISLRLKSVPNLAYKLNKSNVTAYAVAKEVADGINSEYSNTFSTQSPWGHASICDTRQKLQYVVAVPQFLNATTTDLLTHLAEAPFFGVYDGHGGSQVAEYCRDHVHVALAEELEVIVARLNGRRDLLLKIVYNFEEIGENTWRKALARCFRKVDAEVGDALGLGPRFSPEPVGSTAVVAIVCPSYIVVGHCGDSRAVLKRDGESIPLTVDFKTARKDDLYARIEAAGGNIVKWHPCYGEERLMLDDRYASAYLSFPRAIGDRYWDNPCKQCTFPDPEVTLIPRTEGDRCLVLASDGFWDVMTNEEACDIAEEMIRIGKLDRPEESASQAAADYLSRRALQKGSKDNITVSVVDLESLPL